jgi:hypothetical protein
MSEALIVLALVFVGYSASKIAKRRRAERRERREAEEERISNHSFPRTNQTAFIDEDLPSYEEAPAYERDEIKIAKKLSFGQRFKQKLRPHRTAGESSA